MSKHTPGPWRFTNEIHRSKRYVRLYGGEGIHKVQVADINCYPTLPYEANARLIAAAPDLLAALEAIKDEAGCSAGCHDDVMKNALAECLALAHAAIAKAIGEA